MERENQEQEGPRSTSTSSAALRRSSESDLTTATAVRPSDTQSGEVLYEEHDSEEVTSDWLGHSVMTDTDTDTAMSDQVRTHDVR